MLTGIRRHHDLDRARLHSDEFPQEARRFGALLGTVTPRSRRDLDDHHVPRTVRDGVGDRDVRVSERCGPPAREGGRSR